MTYLGKDKCYFTLYPYVLFELCYNQDLVTALKNIFFQVLIINGAPG